MSSVTAKWGRGGPGSDKQTIIRFEEGLIGFSDKKTFALYEDAAIAPFKMLQSTSDPELVFVVLDPAVVVRDYAHLISSRDWESVAVAEPSDQMVLAICNLSAEPSQGKGNFQAPIIINRRKLIGRQVILVESGLSASHPLM